MTDTETDLLAAIDGWRAERYEIAAGDLFVEANLNRYRELRDYIAEATQEIHALHRRERQREAQRV